MKRTGVYKEDRFYQLLSEQCNYVSPETVKSFYLGLVRHITKEMRDNGIAVLPHLGVFCFKKLPTKYGVAGRGGAKLLSNKYCVKFYLEEAWRRYFSKFVERRAGVEPIDPREKMLNRRV
jgi:hypothetical protein